MLRGTRIDRATGAVIRLRRADAPTHRQKRGRGRALVKGRVGTELRKRIEQLLSINAIVSSCACQTLADEMDRWGVAGCEQRREQIVAHLVANRDVLAHALRANGRWAAAMMASIVPDAVLRLGAEQLLTEAIADARTQDVSVRQKKSARSEPKVKVSAFHPPLIGIPINRDRLQSHILYHVMPVAGDTEWVWRRHCDWLREVRPQFNGRLIVGIVTPGEKDSWQYCPSTDVREALAGLEAEFIEAPNDTGNYRRRKHARGGKGEGVLFPQMLARLKTSDPDQVAFYGHCKGVTRPNTPLDSAIHLWAEAMFETVFRNHDAAVAALDTHGICGSFKMPGGYRDGGPGIGSNWFYSGTFFGMRLVDVFGRRWESLPTHYGCVEQWPRLNFDRDNQAACLFFDNVKNLYDEAYWKNEVTPAFEKWKREHGTSRTG